MSFSLTTFTIEINGVSTIAFQAKWQAEAERLCQEWIEAHWDELATAAPGGSDWPPGYKVRLARPVERIAYDADATGTEFFRDVKIVKLTSTAASLDAEPQPNGDMPDDVAANQDHQHPNGGEE